jgi:hypothetical protein
MHASVRRVLRQAWEIDDAEKAKRSFLQSRPPPRTGLELRFRFNPGGDRRDAYCYEARRPSRTAPPARLRQHYRECHGHGAESAVSERPPRWMSSWKRNNADPCPYSGRMNLVVFAKPGWFADNLHMQN